MLDRKAEAVDVVALDKYVQPIDRGPTVAEQKLMRSWQYAVTGKVAAAAVLADLKAEHIKHGKVLAWPMLQCGMHSPDVVTVLFSDFCPLHARRRSGHARRGLQEHPAPPVGGRDLLHR